MKLNTEAQVEALLKEWQCLNDAISALEYFAVAQSRPRPAPKGEGDIEAFTNSLRAQRDACDAAIVEYERLARDQQKKR